MNKKRTALVQGPVGTMSGYGAHTRDLVRSLTKICPKWDIKINDMKWGNTPRNYLKKGRDDDILNRILTKNMEKRPDFFFQVSVPNEVTPVGTWNCIITAGIETNLCSPEWLIGLNKANLAIVPSTHAKGVFENSKFQMKDKNGTIQELMSTTPIESLFEGVDTKVYYKIPKEEKPENNAVYDIMKDVKEDFCFLSVGHWLKGNLGHDRKDIGMLIKTFLATFKNNPKKPALILKTSLGTLSIKDKEETIKRINSIRNDNTLPNVYLIHGELTDSEMNLLYNHKKIKAMVSFTHGEGYGRPLAEFATVGKPIAVSNWSGHTDFLNKDYVSLLPGQLKKIHPSAVWNKVLIPDSSWFYVDYFYAGRIMKEMYKNYTPFKRKAAKQAKLMNEKFTLKDMDRKFKGILKKYLPNLPEVVEPKLPNFKLPKLVKKEEK